MRAFAELLDRLSLTSSRNAKLTLLRDHFAGAPDPDRGWALAALTGDLTFDAAKPAFIRKAVEARMDPVLFGWSYDYVGDRLGRAPTASRNCRRWWTPCAAPRAPRSSG